MKKLFIYYNFILINLLVITSFISASTFPQLIIASLFFPLSIYFSLLVLPHPSKALKIAKIQVIPKSDLPASTLPITAEEITPLTTPGNFDFDRRSFLKLIGSAGLSVFFFAIFNHRAEAAFFGSTPGPGSVSLKDAAGRKINPAKEHPTDGYKISRVADTSPAYYGFTNQNGGWFIMKEDDTGNYTYASGTANFSSSWTGRGGLTYREYFEEF